MDRSLLPWTRRLPSWLPRGGSLPDEAWQARHRLLTWLLVAHLLAIPVYALYRGETLVHGLVEVAPVLAAVLVAVNPSFSRTTRATVTAGGLMLCSGTIVHLSDGMIEAHFHFFVMIPVVALYEAWPPFALGVGYVLVHHGVMGTLDPRSVYNHPAAWERPWVFAAVHATFFAAASAACIANWWLHERARHESLAQARLLTTIVDSLRDGLAVIDSGGDIKLRNPASLELMGTVESEPERVGPVAQYGLFLPDGTPLEQHDLPYVKALAGEHVHDVDLVVRNAGVPTGRVLSFSAVALPPATGEESRDVVVVFRDVTEQHRTEAALTAALATEQRAVERLRELERVKSDFVATVSHELRTPLTSIIGYLELLVDEGETTLDARQLSTLERVGRNSQRLLRLVEDLLTLSHIEGARLTISAVRTDLRDIVAGAREAVALQLDSRSLDVVVDVPGTAVWCDVDAEQLERMLVNLLTNAVKFTPDGGRLGVRLHVEGPDAVLVVWDTGAGVPESEQDQLFTRFFRSSVATQQAVQGTGLGLSIVHAIVALHGGTIAVQSQPGAGTTFTVRLSHRATTSSSLDPVVVSGSDRVEGSLAV